MSFENFDFEIAQIDLLKIFDGSETIPKTGKSMEIQHGKWFMIFYMIMVSAVTGLRSLKRPDLPV